LDCSRFKDFFIKAMIKALKDYTPIFAKKLVMAFPLLKTLGHETASTKWLETGKLPVL
jgi:hypothetical protein